MLALINITAWHWVAFIFCVIIFLALDLGVFHRRAHVVRFREALLWTSVWFCLAMLFAVWLRYARGQKEGLQFVTGYLIELSLSMDNVFVIALIFSYFRIPSEYQHRVLFWGILGALIMRGFMIGIGVALIHLLNWILYVFGALLVFSGIKMMLVETEVEPEKNWVIRLVRKFYPVAPHLDGHKFITQCDGRRALTPLALVLLMVETTDLIFAVDSIPAVFAVTKVPFIVFTSNVFAILGLRSLYFVLAGAISYFRYLKGGLSAVLIFIGIKMLIDPGESPPRWWFQVDIPTSTSLIVVASIILVSMIASVASAQREKRQKRRQTEQTSADKRQPNQGSNNANG
jgi:tellurite resistance protein TerC